MRETKRNPVAKALRSPHLLPKVFPNKKRYSKADRKVRLDDILGYALWTLLATSAAFSSAVEHSLMNERASANR